MAFEELKQKLEKNGFAVSVFSTGEEAAAYLNREINGIAGDTGEIINIDGTGNRVSSSLYGHQKVYLVAGKNKVSPDFHSALHRARNVVAPKNAQRLGRKTPCAAKADHCYDCDSPERICRGLTVLYRKMNRMDMEVILIDQELGY